MEFGNRPAADLGNVTPQMLPAILVIVAVILFRCAVGTADDTLLRTLANFSPMAALALCAGVAFPRKWALAVPLSAQILSDLALHWLGRSMAFSWAYSVVLVVAYAAIVAVGWAVRKQPTPLKLLGASLTGTLLFYFWTNSFSWWQDYGYDKSLAGWVQALTTGLPGYPPTYVFLLKSIGGDLFFTTLFALSLGLFSTAPQPSSKPTEA